MKTKHLFLISILAILLIGLVSTPTKSQFIQNGDPIIGLIAGRNVNMLSGHDPDTMEPYDLNNQRQNEPSMAVSTRNPLPLIAGANDWQPLEMDIVGEELPGVQQGLAVADAWIGIFTSTDGGESWKNRLLPGSLVDTSDESLASPIRGYGAAADPVWRAGAAGMFFGTGITFNRGQRGLGALFVARYIDRNNREGGDPIRYIDTKVIDVGNMGHFIDKCWLVVDVPRTPGTIFLPNGDEVPRMDVFVVYTSFMGDSEEDVHGKLMISVSHDSGETWSKPSQITNAGQPYQAATLAIDPRNGRLHVAWRRFAKDEHTNAIMMLSEKTPKDIEEGYSHEKLKFTKPVVVQEIAPFDQPSIPEFFRTNTYPSMTVDHNGLVYLAYAMRTQNDYSRIYVTVWDPDNNLWYGPTEICQPENLPEYNGMEATHMFMPTISYGAGKITLAWYDSRWDTSDKYYTAFLNDYENTVNWRHTIDVRASQSDPGPNPDFSTSIQVSKYPWILDVYSAPGAIIAEQLKHNFPGLEIFQQGTRAFIGDYIDLAPSPPFIPNGTGGWTYNTGVQSTGFQNTRIQTAAANKPVFHVVWADNRDVYGDLTGFNPPGDPDDPNAPEVPCLDPDQTNSRNQNIYTSRLTRGIIAGSPQNTKQLSIDRAFVVFVKNTTKFEKFVDMTITPLNNCEIACFVERGVESPTLNNIYIPPYSTTSRTVSVKKNLSNLFASVTINVFEHGTQTPLAQITLNPDPTNPELEDPDGGDIIDYTETHTPHIGAYHVIEWNYEEANPHIGAPHIGATPIYGDGEPNDNWVTPHIGAPHIGAPHIGAPHIGAPHIGAPHIGAQSIYAPHIGATHPYAEVPSVSSLTDVYVGVENTGNVASSYALSTLPVEVDHDEIFIQLLVYRVHKTPTAVGCDPVFQEHHELISSITPHIGAPHIGAGRGDFQTSIQNSQLPVDVNIPVEARGKIVLCYRIHDKDKTNDVKVEPRSIIPIVQQDVKDIIDGVQQTYDPPPALVVTTTSLATGYVGLPYSQTLTADGGLLEPTYNYSWNLELGYYPDEWMTIDPNTEVISGIPSVSDIGTDIQVTVSVQDFPPPGITQQTSYKTFFIDVVHPPDLIVESLTHVPEFPTTAEEITFTAVVKNQGLGSADPSTLEFLIENEASGGPGTQFSVPALAPDATYEVQRQATLPASYYTNYATADIDAEVTEFNEDNNIKTDSFTVILPDLTPPSVTSFDPPDDASGTDLDTDLVITFDENVVEDTGNIVIYESDDTMFETIDVTDIGKVAIVDNVVTINPGGTFENGTGYYVQIATSCIKDAAGNHYAGINNTTTWNFSTITLGDLIAYYPFNGNANDESGNGNHGTTYGGATFTEDRFGNPNGAINFDGIDDYVELPNESNFDLTELTIIATIKVPDHNRRNYVISKGSNFGNYTIMIHSLDDGNPAIAAYAHQTQGGNWSAGVTNNPVPLDEFFHIAVTLTSTTFKSYLNGNPQDTAIPSPPLLNDENITIGALRHSGIPDEFFIGAIDEIRIYNYALSATEIAQLSTPEFVTKWGSSGTGDGQFDQPRGMAFDSSGNVYVTDFDNHRVQKFTSDGTFLGWWGRDDNDSTGWHGPGTGRTGASGTGDGQFNYPRGIAVDGSGDVYVTDYSSIPIQKFTSSGTFITKWGGSGSGDGQFNVPEEIAVDSSGNVYVADKNNHRIQKFSSGGTFLGWWGRDDNDSTGWHSPETGRTGASGTGDGQFDQPWGIAVDNSGNVYVTDSGNHRIQKFSSGGTFLGWWGRDDNDSTGWHGPGTGRTGASGTGDGQLQVPWGISVDNLGNVYVADSGNSRVQKFTSSGAFITKWGTNGSGDGQFEFMRGVEVDTLGNIYVSDAGTDRVQKFR